MQDPEVPSEVQVLLQKRQGSQSPHRRGFTPDRSPDRGGGSPSRNMDTRGILPRRGFPEGANAIIRERGGSPWGISPKRTGVDTPERDRMYSRQGSPEAARWGVSKSMVVVDFLVGKEEAGRSASVLDESGISRQIMQQAYQHEDERMRRLQQQLQERTPSPPQGRHDVMRSQANGSACTSYAHSHTSPQNQRTSYTDDSHNSYRPDMAHHVSQGLPANHSAHRQWHAHNNDNNRNDINASSSPPRLPSHPSSFPNKESPVRKSAVTVEPAPPFAPNPNRPSLTHLRESSTDISQSSGASDHPQRAFDVSGANVSPQRLSRIPGGNDAHISFEPSDQPHKRALQTPGGHKSHVRAIVFPERADKRVFGSQEREGWHSLSPQSANRSPTNQSGARAGGSASSGIHLSSAHSVEDGEAVLIILGCIAHAVSFGTVEVISEGALCVGADGRVLHVGREQDMGAVIRKVRCFLFLCIRGVHWCAYVCAYVLACMCVALHVYAQGSVCAS